MRMKWFNENVLDFTDFLRKPRKMFDKIHQNRPQCVVIQNVVSVVLSRARSDHVIFYRRGAVLAGVNVYILCHNLSGMRRRAAPGAAAQLCSTYVLCMVGLVKPDFCSIDVR